MSSAAKKVMVVKGSVPVVGGKRKRTVPIGVETEAEEVGEDEEDNKGRDEGEDEGDDNEEKEGICKQELQESKQDIDEIDFTTMMPEPKRRKRSSRGVPDTQFYMSPVHDKQGRLVFFTIDGGYGARNLLAVFEKRK